MREIPRYDLPSSPVPTLSSTSLDQKLRRLARAHFGDSSRRRGLLVAFEGADGSGKTTQRKLFKTWLKAEGYDVVTTKWNSSALIKPIIKSRKAVRALSPEEFSLLHAADFRHRVEQTFCRRSGTASSSSPIASFSLGSPATSRGASISTGSQALPAAPVARHRLLLLRLARHIEPRVSAGERPTTTKPARMSPRSTIRPRATNGSSRSVIREYESLALIFNFITLDAEQPIGEQHHAIRKLFRESDSARGPTGMPRRSRSGWRCGTPER